MIFAGHTMGTPFLNLHGAIRVFSEIGFEGIEIRCAKDGQIDPETVDDAYLDLVRRWLAEYGVSVTCLTPYNRDFVTAARDSEISALKSVIDIAVKLNCPRVRLYGGTDPVPTGVTREEAWRRTVTGIRELATYAENDGVNLCIETHNGSLTYTATDAVRMVHDVDRENVGILLDFAWVHLAGNEDARQAIDMCLPHLMHCHYKDWVIDRNGPEPQWSACLMGEGSIPWKEFLALLASSGYDGSLADEYERYWHPEDLPSAETGMARNLDYVRRHLTEGERS